MAWAWSSRAPGRPGVSACLVSNRLVSRLLAVGGPQACRVACRVRGRRQGRARVRARAPRTAAGPPRCGRRSRNHARAWPVGRPRPGGAPRAGAAGRDCARTELPTFLVSVKPKRRLSVAIPRHGLRPGCSSPCHASVGPGRRVGIRRAVSAADGAVRRGAAIVVEPASRTPLRFATSAGGRRPPGASVSGGEFLAAARARRAAMTLRPPTVAMRARKPWRRLRTILEGW